MLFRRAVLTLLATVLALFSLSSPALAQEQVDLEVTQSAAPEPAAIGGELTWTILVVNQSRSTATSTCTGRPPSSSR